MHLLKKQLLLALEVVDGVSRITQKLLIHLLDPRTFSNVLGQVNMKLDLDQISSDMEGHKATIRHLLQVVESIGALVRNFGHSIRRPAVLTLSESRHSSS